MTKQEEIDEAVNMTLTDIIQEMTRTLHDAARYGVNRKYFQAMNECKEIVERRFRDIKDNAALQSPMPPVMDDTSAFIYPTKE
jgi:hypothetical protein